jgi:hypothetical protein
MAPLEPGLHGASTPCRCSPGLAAAIAHIG